MSQTRHWTDRSVEDFAYSVASDFIDLLREEMDRLGWSKSRLAKAAKVSKGRITQIFQNPSNLEMITMAKVAKALRMKLTVFPYRDLDDPNNERGPINSEVFRLCWEKAKRPADMWAFEAQHPATPSVVLDAARLNDNLAFQWDVYLRSSGTGTSRNQTGNRMTRQLPIELLDSQNTQSGVEEVWDA